MRSRSTLLVITTATVLLLGALFAVFVRMGAPHEDVSTLPPTAIVFTGQYDRIEFGLSLLVADEIDRLFISGVNAKAGLNVARFADQFSLTGEQESWLENGTLVLSEDANSTLENALETACWLETQPEVQTVTLITSRRHMARASLALQATLAPKRVRRLVSDPAAGMIGFVDQLREFSRYIATWFIVRLPRSYWPVEIPTLCR